MAKNKLVVERTQTGVRMEKRLVKVLKSLAEYLDMSLGDLLEGIVLGQLAPGMFARFRIAYEVHTDALIVPATATVAEDDVTVVYVVEDGAAVRRPVETGIRAGDYVEILEGLGPNDTIVLSGQARLRNGSRVLARAEPDKPAARG